MGTGYEANESEDAIKGATINELPPQRPENFLIGAINDRQELVEAITALNSSGFTQEALFVLFGRQGADAIRHRGEEASRYPIFKWISNRLEELAGGELDSIHRHANVAEGGSYVVGVQLTSDNPQQRDVVRDLLKRHGGYDIILVERNAIYTLDA